MRLGLGRHVDLKPPLEAGAAEDKRFLRQPEEPRLRGDRKAGLDMGGRAVGAVDFFRRGRRRLDLGALVQLSSMRKSSPPATPPPVLTITTSHGLVERGKRQRRPPVS